MKAIILAGGLGERLRPLTNTTPKPLLPIKGKPIIEHAILNFKKHGIRDIIISIGYKAETIKSCFKDGKQLGVNITYCIEDQPLGTGGAIKKAAEGIKETFLAINGDNLADFNWTEEIKEHKKNKAKITLALYPVDDVTQYGIAKLEGKKILEFIEKPSPEKAPSNLNNAGGYVIEPDALSILPEGKSSIERDCFEKLAKKGVVYAFKHTGQWYPTDTLEKYNNAEKNFKPMKENKTSIFRAYDIRGIYPTELDEDTAYRLGRAFVIFLKAKEVLVGRDARLSSPQVFKALAEGITDQGADVIDIGLSCTPLFYFSAKDAKSAIMVTASHNPKEYNGFKLCRENAVPISGDTGIKDIESLVEKNSFKNPKNKGKIIKKDILEDFIRFNLSFVKSKKPIKIVLDAANGMSGYTLPPIFSKLKNISLVKLYCDLDFSFPNHEANPLKFETLKDLQKAVIREKADFGIATDGDGDRCMFIDEKGNIIPSDLLTALIGEEILKQKPGSTILYDLRSSKIVKEIIEKNNGKASMCRVGHSFIKSQMRKEDAIFAGELSGHLYFKEHGFTESTFLAIAYIINLISEEGKPLSSLVSPLRKYFQSGEINSEVKDKDKVLKHIESVSKGAKIMHLDGLSVYHKDFWFNIRASNTEPLLRLNLEADSKKLMEEKRDWLLGLTRA